MSLGVLVSLVLGLGLLIAGLRRLKQAPAQAVALLVGAFVLNAWWLALIAMFLYKTIVLKEDT